MSRYKHSDEEFIQACEGAVTYTQIFERLGLKQSGSSRAVMKRRITELNIDMPGFIGTVGKSHRQRARGFYRKEIHEMTDRGSIKVRLIYEGVLQNECSRCSINTWLGEPLSLELDHIDGDRTNNNISNLRLLCPNCHALTPTWRGRNRKRETNDET